MSAEEEIREALEEVLALYDIKLEERPAAEEETEYDYSDVIGKTQAKLDDLSEKAEEIFKRTGMTREQLEVFAANPNNFTPEQWNALQKVKEACEKYKKEATSRLGERRFEKKVEKREKKKPIGRFAKKKHWIPL